LVWRWVKDRTPKKPEATVRWILTSWALTLLGAVAGCQKASELRYVSSKAVQELPAEQQLRIRELLEKHCGTPSRPRLLGDETLSVDHLRLGAATYQARCAGCHGVSGDGAGPAAEYLQPPPRDYRQGVFKFTSTPFGAKPRREDIVRVVRRGAPGTAMPSFALLPDEELQAVVDYVLVLAQRGELEAALWYQFDDAGEVADADVPPMRTEILEKWNQARNQVVLPVVRETAYTAESIARGRQAFLTERTACFKCHGADGRGKAFETTDPADPGGAPLMTRSADLTAGMFHGGKRPLDIYRRIYSGINGTPMPSFATLLEKEPETIWDLVHYVQYFGDQRRRAVVAANARWLGKPPPNEMVLPTVEPAKLDASSPDKANDGDRSP
jgi:mono/diheme cytochrome c family protein